jgi:phosphatidylinositol kinase/protein kinase (PI-3  family)
LGISPGGNLAFETAAFKLSQEMLELLDGEDSEGYHELEMLTVQCFLAARQIMPSILSVISSFADSDLPCFQYKEDVLVRCRNKFFPELSSYEAMLTMKQLIADAKNDKTTSIYDGIQKLQNNIYSAEWK